MRRVRVVPPTSFVLTTAQAPVECDPDLYFPAPSLTQADAASRQQMLEQMQQLIRNEDDPDVWLILRHVLDGASQRQLSSEAGIHVGTLCRRFQAQRARLIAGALAVETAKRLAIEQSCAYYLPQLKSVEATCNAQEALEYAAQLRCACSPQAIVKALTSKGRPAAGRRSSVRQALLGGLAVAARCDVSNDIVIDLQVLSSRTAGNQS